MVYSYCEEIFCVYIVFFIYLGDYCVGYYMLVIVVFIVRDNIVGIFCWFICVVFCLFYYCFICSVFKVKEVIFFWDICFFDFFFSICNDGSYKVLNDF